MADKEELKSLIGQLLSSSGSQVRVDISIVYSGDDQTSTTTTEETAPLEDVDVTEEPSHDPSEEVADGPSEEEEPTNDEAEFDDGGVSEAESAAEQDFYDLFGD